MRSFILCSQGSIIFAEDWKTYPDVTRENARMYSLSPTGRQIPFPDLTQARQVGAGASQRGPLPGAGPRVLGRRESPSACLA